MRVECNFRITRSGRVADDRERAEGQEEKADIFSGREKERGRETGPRDLWIQAERWVNFTGERIRK